MVTWSGKSSFSVSAVRKASSSSVSSGLSDQTVTVTWSVEGVDCVERVACAERAGCEAGSAVAGACCVDGWGRDCDEVVGSAVAGREVARMKVAMAKMERAAVKVAFNAALNAAVVAVGALVVLVALAVVSAAMDEFGR